MKKILVVEDEQTLREGIVTAFEEAERRGVLQASCNGAALQSDEREEGRQRDPLDQDRNQAKGEIRQQFHHVVDVVPTILQAAGIPEPLMVNGVTQKPLEGVSMNYTFDSPSAPERHETQYFEMYTNRGIYHKGWTACTRRRIPWITSGGEIKPFDDSPLVT